MSRRHLGGRIYDLVAGRLSRDDAYVAMAHLDECTECRSRYDELRADRVALQTSGSGIDMRFTEKLLDRDRIAQIAKTEPKRHVRAARPGFAGLKIAAVVAAGATVVVVGGLWALGAPREVALDIASAGPLGATSNAQTMQAQRMRSDDSLRTWIHPEWADTMLIPVEATVMETPSGATVLVATLLSGHHEIIVTEQHGRLPDSMTTRYAEADVDAHDAYVVDARQLVFETGDVVIGVQCAECEMWVLEGAAEEFPTAEDPGVLERIGDGFDRVSEAVGAER